jgi:hypothetical protein
MPSLFPVPAFRERGNVSSSESGTHRQMIRCSAMDGSWDEGMIKIFKCSFPGIREIFSGFFPDFLFSEIFFRAKKIKKKFPAPVFSGPPSYQPGPPPELSVGEAGLRRQTTLNFYLVYRNTPKTGRI